MITTSILTILLLGWSKRISYSLEIVRYREQYYKDFYKKKLLRVSGSIDEPESSGQDDSIGPVV